MNGWTIAVTSFLACGVEMVEALTIVLAVGVARSWRPAVLGAVWAVVILVAIVAVARPLLLWVEPLPAFKILVGAVALYYGQGWLRKAILRAGGRKALHDEAAIFDQNVEKLKGAADREAFTQSFNGVFFEGVEAVVILLALAAGRPYAMPWAVGGALAAFVLVVATGIALHRPLQRVPENAMKFLVGTMLSTFGIFWIGEGLNVPWPGEDFSILILAVVIFAGSLLAVAVLRRSPAPAPEAGK